MTGIRRVCAYCGKSLGRDVASNRTGTTHGICRQCSDALEEYDALAESFAQAILESGDEEKGWKAGVDPVPVTVSMRCALFIRRDLEAFQARIRDMVLAGRQLEDNGNG